MKLSENTKYILIAVGLLFLGLVFVLYTHTVEIMNSFGQQSSKEVHAHAGFSLYILENRVDLTADKYQSSAESIKHPDMHFHDNIDTMLHRHEEGITLGEFMQSIGITLTDMCLRLDTGEEHCAYENNALQLFVNGTIVKHPSTYVIEEEDQVLLYYGNPASAEIPKLLENISDEACVYSGTCPERGKPPAESCGITCEI